jgi:hypothetical protein
VEVILKHPLQCFIHPLKVVDNKNTHHIKAKILLCVLPSFPGFHSAVESSMEKHNTKVIGGERGRREEGEGDEEGGGRERDEGEVP